MEQKGPEALGEILSRLFAARGWGRRQDRLRLEQAWAAAKSSTDARTMAVADRALAELAELYARLGRVEQLDALAKEVERRPLSGSVAERLASAKQGLWIMKNRPEVAFRCGPLAVERLFLLMNPENTYHWLSLKTVVRREIPEEDPAEGQRVTDQLDRIWVKYTGNEPPYALRDPSMDERRVLFELEVSP